MKHRPLKARNFRSAGEDAAKTKPPSLYDGPGSAYRLAFTDIDFLLQEELRPVRVQLELLKPEMVQARARHRVDHRAVRQRPHHAARGRAANCWPSRARAATRWRSGAPRRVVAMSHHYDEARRFAAMVTRGHAPPGHADPRRHRRRPRHHGGGQPRRVRGRRQEHRPEHRAAARAAAQPVHHAGAVLPVPLLRAAQDALPDARGRAGRAFPAASARSTSCSRC